MEMLDKMKTTAGIAILLFPLKYLWSTGRLNCDSGELGGEDFTRVVAREQRKWSSASVSSVTFSLIELSACHLIAMVKRWNLQIKAAHMYNM
ncbi:hypothetical protein NC652_029872 [Populus alba x Populus x berolinensis]|nr:hypothetical protein NC652_029872 [Populus alba x Populus x berolinensis]